jgi:hypothetical protein
MILLNRNISILSVMVMMTIAVMATVTVAFATPNEGSNGRAKVEICHKGQIITVAEPAVAAHVRHGDDPALCENPDGTTPVLTTQATTPVTLGDPGRRDKRRDWDNNAHAVRPVRRQRRSGDRTDRLLRRR